MTDQELIALLDERRPQDWTPDEIALLRQRLPHSAELRAALQSELRLERGLTETLGKYDVPVDLILARAAGRGGVSRIVMLLGWTVAALLLTAGALWWNGAFNPPPEIARVESTAESTAQATSEPTPQATTEPTPAMPAATFEPTGDATPDATPMREGMPAPPVAPVSPAPAPAPEVKLVLREADIFEDFIRQRVPPSEEELKKLVPAWPGQGLRYFTGPDRAGAGCDGIGKLDLPNGQWPEGAVLRMALYELQHFKLHAWNNLDGATFWFHQGDPQRWSSYATHRDNANEPRPSRFTSGGIDPYVWHRLGDGWVDLRYENGRLKLCRSDVVMLEAPMERPTQIVFDGHVCFRAMEWVSTAPPAETPTVAMQTLYRSVEPERLPWTTTLTGAAKFETREGVVRIERKEKHHEQSTAAHVVERPGMYAVDFLVEDFQPGSGVFLGDSLGAPVAKLGFYRERRTGATIFKWVFPWDGHIDAEVEPNHEPIPFAGKPQWVRLVVGANVVRCYASLDGSDWRPSLEPYRQQNSGDKPFGGFMSSGVYVLQGDTPRGITLREMRVSEPIALRDAGGAEIAERALAFAFAADSGEWLKLVAEHKPIGVDDAAWRAACAYKTIAHRSVRNAGDAKLTNALWSGLINDALQLAPTADARLAVLQTAAIGANAWEWNEGTPWYEKYEQVGRELAREGEPAPWSRLRLAMYTSPIYARGWHDVEPASLARQELLNLVGKQEWLGVRELVRRLRIPNQPVHPHHRPKNERRNVLDLADWCDAVASRALPRQAGETIALSVDWRRPLVEQLSKEGYNLLAEFEAAMSSKSYRDACQIVASCSPSAALGVAPDSRDPALLVSLPSAVALAMRETPELQRTMEKEFGAVGKFRIRAATGEADAATVEAATVQFYGTAAAVEAHVWLGDRALATGDFAAAGSQYRRAADALGGQPSPSIEARRRLAAAFQGRDYGATTSAPVALADQTLDATAFEALVAAARSRSDRGASPGDAVPVPPIDAPPAPGEYSVKSFAQTSGEHGREHERVGDKEADLFGRVTTTLIAGDLFVTHNRFQTTAFDLKNGQQKWSIGLGGQQGHAHKWLTPMRPLLVQGKLLLRRLTENGPELAAIELETGKVLWRQQPGHHVASDPMWVQQELFALGVSGVGADQLQLELVTFALETGEPVARRKLALFRNAWNSAIPCSAAVSGDRIIAAAGGAIVCTDLLGQVQWMREQNWIPSKQDESSSRLGTSTPVIADGRVYVSQPNVRSVDCLDLDGGRLQWRRTYESLQGMLGLAGAKRDVLLLSLDEGVEALRLADGQSLWRRTGGLDAEGTVAGTDSVLTVERAPTDNQQYRLRFVWLDPQSGKLTASSLLGFGENAKTEGRRPQFGPLVTSNGRFWGYYNAEEKSPDRKIYELTKAGPAPTSPPNDSGTANYAQVSPRLSAEATGFAPGWQLLASPEHQQSGRQAKWENHDNVLLTMCRQDSATAWGGLVTLSADKPASLKLEVAYVRDQPFRLYVRAGDKTLADWVVSPETAPSHWAPLEVDLTSLAGRTSWIEVRQEAIQGREAFAAWQTIQVVTP